MPELEKIIAIWLALTLLFVMFAVAAHVERFVKHARSRRLARQLPRIPARRPS